MGYPIYKLLRAVNRQYPNNGFINYVDVREDMYNGELIDEDLRDLINETIQEVYKDVAIDEVYSFPTVPGQNQYVLPEDCDLRDIQEVTRTYQGWRGPLCPPPEPPPLTPVYTLYFDNNGKVVHEDGSVTYLSGEGVMEPMECNIGDKIVLPDCEFEPPEGYQFKCWEINGVEYQPGDEVEMQGDFIATPIWEEATDTYRVEIYMGLPNTYCIIHYQPKNGTLQEQEIRYGGEPFGFDVPAGSSIGDVYDVLGAYTADGVLLTDYTGITPTGNMQIPVIRPTINIIYFKTLAAKGNFVRGSVVGEYSVVEQSVIDRVLEIPLYEAETPGDTIVAWNDGTNTYTTSQLMALTVQNGDTFTAIWESDNIAVPVVEPEDERPGGE